MPVKQVPSPIAAYAAHIIRGLIDDEASLEVHEREHLEGTKKGVVLDVRVASMDVGKVLGRGGENADAIRRLLYAFGKKHRLGHIVFQASEGGRL